MSEKACPDCRLLSTESHCPNCKTPNLSDDFSGLAIIFDPEGSAIANAMRIKAKGRYVVRVR